MPIKGAKLCGDAGHRTKSGKLCTQPAMENGACYRHGGPSLKGISHPNFKHGRYSKHLPGGLREKYEEALNDPRLLSLDEDIALLGSFINNAIAKLEGGESGALFTQLKAEAEKMREAQRNRDKLKGAIEAADALNEILKLIDKGAGEWAAILDIRRMLQERKALSESERKALVEAQQFVKVDQVMGAMKALFESVRTNVSDPKIRNAIYADFVRITGARDSAGIIDGESRTLGAG